MSVINVTDEPIKYAESRQRIIRWKYEDLSDSSPKDVYTKIKYCSPSACFSKNFTSSSDGVLLELSANTTYNYTLQVVDGVHMKFGNKSEVKQFSTHTSGIANKNISKSNKRTLHE